jgi:hypothetical protein
MRPLIALALSSLALFCGVTSDGKESERSDTANAFEELVLTEPEPIAFYEIAPPRVAKNMRNAAQRVCSGGSISGDNGDSLPEDREEWRWLCNSSDLQFFNGVKIGGGKADNIGFICNRAEPNVGFRINLGIMLGKARECVAVEPSHEGKHLILNASYHSSMGDAGLLQVESRPIAVYVTAPLHVKQAMRKAADKACASAGGTLVRSYGDKLPSHELTWLCDGSVADFYSGIRIDGTKVSSGYICSKEESSIGFKFNLAFMFDRTIDCVAVTEDLETKALAIHLNR